MRSRSLSLMLAVLVLILVSMSGVAQAQGGRGNRAAAPAPPPDTRTFDPHDFTGYWLKNTVRPKEHPALTPAGMKAKEGRRPDSEVKLPTDSNDPMYKCNPQGFPRLTYEENEPVEFVMLNDRFLQMYQWERTIRELWLDGRKLPSGENLENLGNTWYGHSVAHWEGNTLVVQTTGLDERAWLDEYGNPKSFDALFEERYTRTSYDTIDAQLTINDPKYYTGPWVVPTSTFHRMKEKDVNSFGWKGLFGGNGDAICAPANEIDDFDKRFRDPAVFGESK